MYIAQKPGGRRLNIVRALRLGLWLASLIILNVATNHSNVSAAHLPQRMNVEFESPLPVGFTAPALENAQTTQTGDKKNDNNRALNTKTPNGILSGRITDPLGGVIITATVIASDEHGTERVAQTDDEGIYAFSNLSTGRYKVRASANGFALFESATINLASGRRATLNIQMSVSLEKQEVNVSAEEPQGISLPNNLNGLVLRGKDLDALPDSPGGLEAALRALAIRSAGASGPQIIVDGFTGNRLPPKNSIREIRINQNPFSAEHDQLSFGRIEILTKPGTNQFRFQAFTNFNDESLNSRNPFAQTRAPYQLQRYGGNVSGPIIRNRASFFIDIENQRIEDNAFINATVLDSNFNLAPFNSSLIVPQRRTTFSPRFDYQINRSHTLVARYNFSRARSMNAGIGSFSLPSRAYNIFNNDHTLQLTETAVLNEKTINETRFQYINARRQEEGDNSSASIIVPDAFTGGGSSVGNGFNRDNRWELHNITTLVRGNHILKSGVRVRGLRVANVSTQNFGGTFIFAGGFAPKLDADNQIVRDANGLPLYISITGIESYRRTLIFAGQGLTLAERLALGAGATQFSIAAGDPLAQVNQYDSGAFVLDDWRVRPNFTMSLGLRYESQTNIKDRKNLSPRIAVAWSPDGNAKQPKTVIRAGFGTFYERFNEGYTLQANRANGANQQRYIVSDAVLLDSFPSVPSSAALAAFAVPQTTIRVADNLSAPLTMQSSLSIERQFPLNISFAASYVNTSSRRALRSRNTNAPLPGVFTPDASNGTRPFENIGDVFQYESSGRFKQNQLILNTVSRLKRSATFWATYILSKAESDTDGADSFPANSYDLSAEYGRSILDVRHTFYMGGWVNAPWGIELSPFVYARSGVPYNITTGRDQNGDTLFTERPAFAMDATKPGVIQTRFGLFDLNPAADQLIIPRNFGQGTKFFSVNLRASKTFGFKLKSAASSSSGARRGGIRDALARRLTDRDFSMTFSIQAENIFNRTNADIPIGNLSSPLFGHSTSSAGAYGLGSNPAGNRRLEFQLSFDF